MIATQFYSPNLGKISKEVKAAAGAEVEDEAAGLGIVSKMAGSSPGRGLETDLTDLKIEVMDDLLTGIDLERTEAPEVCFFQGWKERCNPR